MIELTTLMGPGPMARTVLEPAAICVLPASRMLCAANPMLIACACNINL